MLAIIVVVLGAIAIVAIAFSSYLSMVSSSSQIIKSLEEKRIINDISSSIQQLMKPLGQDRLLIVPNGVSVADKDYLLPPQGVSSQVRNSWGKDIMYCPFSLSQGVGTDTILAGDGETYSATLVTDSNGVEYVYSVESGADPTNTDLVAAIISPLPTNTSPSCSDIRFDSQEGSYFTVNYDGIVYPVVYSSFVVSNQAKSVRPDPESNADVAELFSDWHSIIPDVTNVVLEARVGSYTTSDLLFINDSQSKSKAIVMKGEGISSSIIDGASASIVFENVTVNLSDMSFSQGVSVEFVNSDVTLNNVAINNVTINSSDVYLKGVSNIYSGSTPFSIYNSSVSGKSASLNIYKEGNIGAELKGSSLSVDNLSVNNTSPNGVGVVIGDASSLLIGQSITSSGDYLDNVLGIASGGSLNNSNININISNAVDTFLFNQGDVYLDDVFINFNSSVIRGIILGLNSDTVLNQVQVGSDTSRPDVGIQDIGGAKFIGGFGTQVYATSECWSGDIFLSVDASAMGSTSESQTNANKSSNRSVWTCNI